MKKDGHSKPNKVLFFLGLAAILAGTVILSFLAGRKLLRDYGRSQLMKNNAVIEIPELRIKAPVLEGTGNDVLSKAAGHFPGTGAPGEGNYCISAHSSTIYKEYFNALRDVQNGMEVRLYDVSNNLYTYYVTDSFIVEPDETWILDDAEDVRVTLVTCTDDGTQRRIVIAKPEKENGCDPVRSPNKLQYQQKARRAVRRALLFTE